MLTTNQKGAIAELAIVQEALRLGIGVYGSFADERYDLIFDLRPQLVRVQCKSACRYGEVIIARLYSARRTADGLTRRLYSPDEVDAFAVHCPDTGGCYYLAMETFAGRSQVMLRLSGARNNQKAGVNWATEYEFGATLPAILGP